MHHCKLVRLIMKHRRYIPLWFWFLLEFLVTASFLHCIQLMIAHLHHVKAIVAVKLHKRPMLPSLFLSKKALCADFKFGKIRLRPLFCRQCTDSRRWLFAFLLAQTRMVVCDKWPMWMPLFGVCRVLGYVNFCPRTNNRRNCWNFPNVV